VQRLFGRRYREVAVARAAAARGTVMSLSNFASKPIEDVVAANPNTFFQMYWTGDLAANGQTGVGNVLDILRGGIDSALRGLGVASIHELGPDHLVVPEGFHRALGADTPRTERVTHAIRCELCHSAFPSP
jgi:isopentenyl diphosphate isomerase/L-lactate dehydrogenase-like FMN-dependent dehydrogenase